MRWLTDLLAGWLSFFVCSPGSPQAQSSQRVQATCVPSSCGCGCSGSPLHTWREAAPAARRAQSQLRQQHQQQQERLRLKMGRQQSQGQSGRDVEVRGATGQSCNFLPRFVHMPSRQRLPCNVAGGTAPPLLPCARAACKVTSTTAALQAASRNLIQRGSCLPPKQTQ